MVGTGLLSLELTTYKQNHSSSACWPRCTDIADQNTADLGRENWHVECDLHGEGGLSWCWGNMRGPNQTELTSPKQQSQLNSHTP